jgi:hypothetical protein
VNIPVALVVLLGGARSLPRQHTRAAPGPIDLAGITVTLLFLLCLVMGISRLPDSATGMLLWPWFLVDSGLLLVALVAIENRQAQALVPMALFANRQLAFAYGLTLGVGFSMGGIVFLTTMATLAYGVSVEYAVTVCLRGSLHRRTWVSYHDNAICLVDSGIGEGLFKDSLL